MDYIRRTNSLDQLKAHAKVARALQHLSSEDFLGLDESEKRAHAAAYRAELPKLQSIVPQHPTSLNSIHLLRTYLELFE